MKIDFLVVQNQYSSTLAFTKGLQLAFEKLGVKTRVFAMDSPDVRDHFTAWRLEPADMSISFSYIGFQGTEGQDTYIGDYLEKPHLTYWIDGSIFSLPLFSSPYNLVSVVDQGDYHYLKKTMQNKLIQNKLIQDKLLFLPHAVEYESEEIAQKDRPYAITMTATFLDYKVRQAEWQNKYSSELCKAMQKCSEDVLSEGKTSLLQSLAHALEAFGIDPLKDAFQEIYYDVEYYCKGRERVELLQSLSEFDIHLFGSSDSSNSWKKALKGSKNITVHAPVSYRESLELLEQSKIVLNSSPQFRCGSHERIFNGLAKGAVVVTNENTYIEEQFLKDSGVLYYHPHKTKELCLQIRDMLKCEELRMSASRKGRALVMKEHTWYARAAQIIQLLNL